MSLLETLQMLRKNGERVRDRLDTEEATKNALVMPFLRALGFDPFDPDAVVPEFTADVGVKKGEKVDYALKKDGELIVLVECKACNANLKDVHYNQLFRYFSVTTARVAVLTNGFDWWFFSDVDERNKLDTKPFYRFALDEFNEADVRQLEKFSSRTFDANALDETASTLKYTSLIKNEIKNEISNPSDDLVRLLTKRVYSGHYTNSIRELFSPLVATAFNETIRDLVNIRLTHALSQVNDTTDSQAEATTFDEEKPDSDIVTTEEEIESFLIIKNIARRYVNKNRIVMRDQKSYCNVLLDNNNRKPIIRFYFSGNQKRVSFAKESDRVPIETVDELFDMEERIRQVIEAYESGADA